MEGFTPGAGGAVNNTILLNDDFGNANLQLFLAEGFFCDTPGCIDDTYHGALTEASSFGPWEATWLDDYMLVAGVMSGGKLAIEGGTAIYDCIRSSSLVGCGASLLGGYFGTAGRRGGGLIDEGAMLLNRGCSFSEDTLVTTADGLVPIGDVEAGTYVLAYNEETGEIGYYPVTAVWAHLDPVIVRLTIDGEVILTTPEHPFYTTEGEWVAAADLQQGDNIRTAKWLTGTIKEIEFLNRPQVMYNFTVDVAHTYFVGEEQVLVHNSCPPQYLIHFTTEKNYQKIINDGFTLKPSHPEMTAPSGIYFGDTDPLFPDVPFSPVSIQALWGISDRTRFLIIDTSKLSDPKWFSRSSNTTRTEWILETDVPVDVSNAVINHGSIDLLNP